MTNRRPREVDWICKGCGYVIRSHLPPWPPYSEQRVQGSHVCRFNKVQELEDHLILGTGLVGAFITVAFVVMPPAERNIFVLALGMELMGLAVLRIMWNEAKI